MSEDIGDLARAIVEAKRRRAEMSADELFWLEFEEDKQRQFARLNAEAQHEAEKASSTGGNHE